MSGFAEALEQARDSGDLLSGGAFSQETAADLDGSGLDFRDCRFQSCQFRDCDFSGAAFLNCRFESCDLTGCRLPGTFWRECCLAGCKADGADLRRSRLKDTALEQSLFRCVPFTGGRWDRVSVKDCSFTDSVLSELHLSKVVLHQTDLSRAELFRTSLSGMDLTTCTLDGIVLSQSCAELKGATIHAAQAAVVARVLGITVKP